MSQQPRIVREGEQDNTLEHYTDTDPNRIRDQNQNNSNNNLSSSDNPPPNRRRSSAKPEMVGFAPITIEGTDGNPLRGQPQQDEQTAEAPQVGIAVDVTAAPSMAPKRRGKAAVAGEDSGNLTISQSMAGGMGDYALSATNNTLTTSMGSPSNSKTLDARRKQVQGQEKNGQKQGKKQEHNMFQSMMLGNGFNPKDHDDEHYSPSHYDHGGDGARSVRRGSGESRAVTNVPGGNRGGVGDVIGSLPQDDGPAMLIPATMEAPEQIFMPNMKREPYVPVRLARDKIKQALSEIASHNSKHYAAIETMEKQYDILKAQMEHQVATYAKKLTMHYNQRVADLNNQLKERLSSGAKGQAFSQLMSDVEMWKTRATDAESELELMKKQLEKVKAERDEALERAYQAEQQGRGTKANNKSSSIDDEI